MTPLYVELNRWRRLTYRWGEADCVTLCADWCVRCGWPDPAADLRLTYESMAECQRVTRFFSDPLAVVAPRMAAAGLALTAQPVGGDVGIVLQIAPGVTRPHAALCLGEAWAVKETSGAVTAFRPQKVLAAWGVGYAHP
ncbi:hypothetical protein IQ03_00561 [Gemmobacter caeni]|uniref:DUF6950 domain-containing protein n=1 Tax=Gemmobacter caeni TaxID=589035 RepID=A0A2T6A5L9_9RHOB|nr:hypothetical protein [Gemmobacter caeni]PTX39076.1 hypothetical protein C8N34_1398 [Gemmobacter caeni]TWJ05753.1 hypothetical protein IQ03_00561 [Gemmobacter caeni]